MFRNLKEHLDYEKEKRDLIKKYEGKISDYDLLLLIRGLRCRHELKSLLKSVEEVNKKYEEYKSRIEGS